MANSNEQKQPSGSAGHPLDRYSVAPQSSDGGGGNDSPYYKSAAPSIALPKGGGALKGIDEKFSVNAVNGTAGLSVPLPLTPGRGGFSPALSLSYNSGSGNSPFGLGWSLGLPSIRRKTDKCLPLYDDLGDSDTFLLAGAEDLVPKLKIDNGEWVEDLSAISGTAGTFLIRRYIPRIEGLFARIEHISKLGMKGSWWRVTSKDNITTYYGLSPEGRIADPENVERIFEWLPQLVFDAKGNVQEYRYVKENDSNVPNALHEQNRKNGNALFTNTYLKSVHYCNRNPQFVDAANVYQPGFPAAPEYLMEAVLDYGDHSETNYTPDGDIYWPCRADAFSDFHAGFEIRTYRRCRRVLMFHRFNELNSDESDTPVLVRSLAFTYAQDGATGNALAEADLLLSAVQTGYLYDGSGTYTSKSLPPMTMDYAPLQWDTSLHNVAPGDLENAPQGLSGAYQWTDLWGEGLPGILTEQAGGWFYKSNLGDAHFTPAMPVAEKPSFAGLGKAMQWQDLDADGRRQLVSYDLATAGYFELNDEQEWEGFRSFKELVNVDWHSPYTKMLDLDGDGRPDLLLTEEAVWSWYANKGTEGFTTGGQASQSRDEELGPRLLLNDAIQRIFLADMNGDGMTDLVRITNGEVCYWPNKGRGAFGAKVAMSNAPRFAEPDIYNPLFLHLADISGTGAPDLLYRNADGTITAWINCAGNGFSEAVSLGQLPHSAPDTVISMIDLLGSGTSCIVWSSPLPADATAPMRYMDLMVGIKPYLMRGYHNGMGKRVDVTYRSSAKYYLEDKMDGTPWATRLPFPVQCIDNITTTDTVSETMYTQTYRYHHGYYDHDEREFRGFGRVDVIDIDTATIHDSTGPIPNPQLPIPPSLDQSPVLTKTWYHTGAWIREGSLLAAFAQEYNHFAGWDALPEQAAFPAGLSAIELREAHRALKGSALRQEVYALDASPDEDKPYTVTVSAYDVLAVQPKGENRFGSFRVQGQQSLAWSTERVPEDARLAQSLTLETDELGNVLKSAQVVYPRRNNADTMDLHDLWALVHTCYNDDAALKAALDDFFDPESLAGEAVRESLAALGILSGNAVDGYGLMPQPVAGAVQLYLPFPVAVAQSLMHITGSVQAFTTDVIAPDAYRLRLPYEAQGYEISGYQKPTGLWTPAALLAAINNAAEIDYAAVPDASVMQKRLLSHTRARYLSDTTTTALGFGVHESLGLPYEHYALAFTDAIRDVLYGTRVNDNMLHDDGGYVCPDGDGCWWVPSGTAQYSSAPAADFYSPVSFIDPWGNNAANISYWGDYYLLPASTEDAAGNVSSVLAYDWHTLQPLKLQDVNDNISEMHYDALGMPVAMALKGKDDGTEGDTLDDLAADDAGDLAAQAAFWADPEAGAPDLIKGATFRCLYNLGGTPTAVAMIGREAHYVDDSASPLIIRITYTDGFGRVILHKAQAADDPATGAVRWIGTGRTVYNNKGKPVMQYEPYFSATHACDTAEQAASEGVSPRIYYDALGRAYHTELPDGTFSKVEWMGWQQQSFDPNDTVRGSDWYAQRTGSGALAGVSEEADAAAKSIQHDGTPVTVHLDTLGRPFYTIQQNTYPDPAGSSNPWLTEYLHTYEALDIAGDRLAVHDGRGLVPLVYRYNPLKTAGYQHSIDGGEGRMLGDVAGQPLYHWDAEDRQFYTDHDPLRRPVTSLVTVGGATRVLGMTAYGEGAANDKLRNLRGQVLHSYDGAGKHYLEGYDFKGQPWPGHLRLLSDATMADADWAVLSDSDLGAEVFTTGVLSDALGRPVMVTDAGGNKTYHTYGKDGALKTVKVGSDTYVQDIRHNAKGQREAIWYGNGTKTGYTYDALSNRLRRLLTVDVDSTHPNYNEPLQDLNYYYDAVGNITTIRDDAQQTIFYHNSLISPDQSYTYDSLYRLVKAEGREGIGLATAASPDSWADSDKVDSTVLPSNTTAVQRYVQKYRYDKAGNILELKHIAAAGSYTRGFDIDSASNRLVDTAVGSPATTYSYSHDVRGNMTVMPHLSTMDYDVMNQMHHITAGTTGAYYQYSGGQRIRKYLSKSGGITEERLYLGSYEIYRKRNSSGAITLERTTVHVADDSGRIAMLEKRTVGSDGSPASLKRFVYSNHLQSAALELDDTGAVISYEEYHPYGTTSYQAMDNTINAVAKRYRYTGKERDEESGLNYHGARYYAPWLCRWGAVDPLESKYAGMSPYNYCFNNPIIHIDTTGKEPPVQENFSLLSNMNIEFMGGKTTSGSPYFNVNELIKNNTKVKEITQKQDYVENGIEFYTANADSFHIDATGQRRDNKTDSKDAYVKASTTVSVYLQGSSTPIDISNVQAKDVGKISSFAINLNFDKDLHDYEIIDSFSHELDHGVEAANLILQFKKGELDFHTLQEKFRKMSLESPMAGHQDIGNNQGPFHVVGESLLNQLSGSKFHTDLRDIFPEFRREGAESELSSDGLHVPDGTRTYTRLSNFYNVSANELNKDISNYNPTRDVPNDFPLEVIYDTDSHKRHVFRKTNEARQVNH